jgi:aminotransferase
MNWDYKASRDFVYGRLQRIGLTGEKPEGAFYLFPSISRFGLSSMDFTMKLLEEERVAVVPGEAFSIYGEGYIRISYAYSMEVLEKAMDKLESFVGRLG